MSWMKLKRFVPHRKVWKLLTTKLSFKINRNKKTSHKRCKKLGWPSLSLRPKKFKKKPNSHKHRLAAPVFVDQLFIEPVVSAAAGKENIRLYSGKDEKDEDAGVSGDDVWESMVLASPQMDGINQRAEEFIARFRADMRHQEMLARRL